MHINNKENRKKPSKFAVYNDISDLSINNIIALDEVELKTYDSLDECISDAYIPKKR